MALELVAHHTPSQLQSHYRRCSDPVEKTHWWIIWKLSQEEDSVERIARDAGVGSQWVYKLKDRYNAQGAEGLRDRRADNGAQPLLDQAGLDLLRRALDQAPDDGGLWSGPKVARWMAAYLGHRVDLVTGWLYLKKLKMSWKVPRPQHAQSATVEEKAAYKKTRPGLGRTGRKASGPKGRTLGRR